MMTAMAMAAFPWATEAATIMAIPAIMITIQDTMAGMTASIIRATATIFMIEAGTAASGTTIIAAIGRASAKHGATIRAAPAAPGKAARATATGRDGPLSRADGLRTAG